MLPPSATILPQAAAFARRAGPCDRLEDLPFIPLPLTTAEMFALFVKLATVDLHLPLAGGPNDYPM